MRTLTLAAALTLGLCLFANEAKAQYVRIGTGYNTYYVPNYVVGGYSYPGYYGMPYTRAYSPYYAGSYGPFYGSGVAVTTPGISYTYGNPTYGYYAPAYRYGYYRGWRWR